MASVMSFPTRIVYGKGAIQELPNELKRAGASRPLLVTDKGILQAGLLRFVTPLLEQVGIKTRLFTEFEANPTDQDALRGIEAYRAAGADSVLGIGGGASLDMAKAVALLVNHEPPLAQYDDAKGGDAKITARVPPIVQVPTTAGTGSEVGRSTVLVIDGTKTVIFSPHLMAKAAILDPELTVGLPPFITAATGMDALTHNLEAYVAKGDHPLADAIAIDGLRRIGAHLRRAVQNGKDLEAREQMLLGSAFGAIAFQKGLGACHSVAHALTPVAGTHHGLANSLMLPAVTNFNRVAVEERLANAAVALGADPKLSQQERAHLCVELIDNLRSACGLPRRLSQAGVRREMIPQIVQKALADACHLSNPRPVTQVDFERLIDEAF
ncbi:MAG: iron-containing alcohol dehydrogenase [Deltaproteobacteria bacterium]|nr:MAG: iron-containing alcohol dehydrogenase [Deltaproteobacteria bacterium]TMA76661.1 MAG: iron-containing alcohol dehydrogenase [Deltaproteobacteria bacterium]